MSENALPNTSEFDRMTIPYADNTAKCREGLLDGYSSRNATQSLKDKYLTFGPGLAVHPCTVVGCSMLNTAMGQLIVHFSNPKYEGYVYN